MRAVRAVVFILIIFLSVTLNKKNLVSSTTPVLPGYSQSNVSSRLPRTSASQLSQLNSTGGGGGLKSHNGRNTTTNAQNRGNLRTRFVNKLKIFNKKLSSYTCVI